MTAAASNLPGFTWYSSRFACKFLEYRDTGNTCFWMLVRFDLISGRSGMIIFVVRPYFLQSSELQSPFCTYCCTSSQHFSFSSNLRAQNMDGALDHNDDEALLQAILEQ